MGDVSAADFEYFEYRPCEWTCNVLPILLHILTKETMSSTTFLSSQRSSQSPNSPPSTSGDESSLLRSPSWPVAHSSSVDNVMGDVVNAQIEHSLWFYDGTVVLQAGSSLFKLHTSILGHRSVIFDNCLNWGQLPESSGGRPIFSEGCMFEGDRVIHILDDEQDAKFFFWAIYDSGSVSIFWIYLALTRHCGGRCCGYVSNLSLSLS